jgi:hypothetical protein
VWEIPANGTRLQALRVEKDLLTHFGEISYAQVRDHALTYYTRQTKQAQDAFMAYFCIYDSLDVEFVKRINMQTEKFYLPPTANNAQRTPNAAMLLKVVISEAHVDTRATLSHIRMQLTQLDEKMQELDFNVEDFNLYVHGKIKGLTSRGATSTDLFENVIRGYEKVPDTNFKEWMSRKVDEYEEGADIEIHELMNKALNKYKTRLLKKEWNVPSKEQEQIIALTAQLSKMSNKKGSAKVTQGKKNKDKPKSDKDASWAWKKVAPKEGEGKTKTVKGRSYMWNSCVNHPNRWITHKTAECKVSAKGSKSATPKGQPKVENEKKQETESEKNRYNKAKVAAAMLADSDEESE